MALTTVTLHGQIVAPVTNTPAVGTVTFKILNELRDGVDNIIYSPMEFNVTLDAFGEFSIVLPVTDNPDVSPIDWTYWVYVDTNLWTELFYMPLPSDMGDPVEFADLLPISDRTGSACTPDGSACAPSSVVGEIVALQAEIEAIQTEIDSLQDQIDALGDEVADLSAQVAALDAQVVVINGQIVALQTDVADNTADIVVLQGQVATLQGQVATLQGQVATNTANIATNTANIAANTAAITVLQGQITNINAAWITTGTLAYQRLGGTIAENDSVIFNRATLVSPGTAADTWVYRYNGVRVTYVNEYACLRVRGIPDNQVPARFMSNLAWDNTTQPTFQVSLSDAATHLFQVLANGDILARTSSMLPTTLAVSFTAPAQNAALINDGNVVNTGAPYACTTTYIPADNRVWMDGNLSNPGASIGAQTTLFTVAAAHRPAAWVQFTARTSSNLAVRLTVKGATGVCVADQAIATGVTLNLDGFNWRKAV